MEFAGTGVVTRQGQVTLPKDARESLDIEQGEMLEFFYSEDLVLIRKRRSPMDIFKSIAKKTEKRFAKKGVTRKDVAEEIRKYREEKYGSSGRS